MNATSTFPWALALFVASAGCVLSSPNSTVLATVLATPIEAEFSGGTTVLSNAGRYRVTYLPLPDAIPAGELFAMRVWIHDAETDELLRDVGLVVDAGMPHHQHGMNTKPLLTEEHSGAYRAENLLFHMPGAWTITFDIERAGVTERAQTVVDVD